MACPSRARLAISGVLGITGPMVSRKRRERRGMGPQGLGQHSLLSCPKLSISCGKTLNSLFWQMGKQPSSQGAVKIRNWVYGMGKARTLVGRGRGERRPRPLVQPSVRPSLCQPLAALTQPCKPPPQLCPLLSLWLEGPNNSCSFLKDQHQGSPTLLAWPAPFYQAQTSCHYVPTPGQV